VGLDLLGLLLHIGELVLKYLKQTFDGLLPLLIRDFLILLGQLIRSDDFLQLLSIFLGFSFRGICGKAEGTDIFHVQEGHRWLLQLVGHKHAKYLLSVCDLIRDPFYVLDFQDLSLSLPSQLSLELLLKLT
jgi:hypothetical protein